MPGEEITTRFSVDVSELKAGIQEANRQIKLANSEFKKATAGMDSWTDSADGLTAKIEQLSKVEQAEIKKLNALQQEYAQVAAEQGENSTAAQNLMVKINNQEAAVARTQKELNNYQNKLNDVTASSGRTATASETLKAAINEQEKELSDLTSAYKDVVLEQGENSAEAQELAAKITALNSDLQANKTKLNEADSAAEKLTQSMDDVGTETADASDGFTVMRGALSGLIANGISAGISKIGELAGSIFNLAEETEEYRSMLAKVEGSANSFGYSIDYAKERYKEFYSYLGDDQMATNAITNLMGLGVETATLDDLAEGAIATWTAYGDSIPIESLTESITETVNVSKVTGTLADTLNWASMSNEQWAAVLGNGSAAQKAFNSAIAEGLPVEDAFNAALAATSDKQERANMVAQVLNQTYGESKTTYDELSGSMINANKAEAELKDTQAELAKSIEPINTEFTKLKTKALKTLSPAIKDVADEFKGLLNDIDYDGAASVISSLLKSTASGLSFLLRNIEPIAAAVKALTAAWVAYEVAQLAANATTKIANATMTVTTTIQKAATAGTIAHTAATKASTIATKALAVAQKMTPWGLVASLAIGAGVALMSFISKTNEATTANSKNTAATKEVTQSYKEYSDALAQNKQAREDAITSSAAEIQSADILLTKLDELANTENKTNAQKALMTEYVKQLNSLIPGLNLQYDQEADKLNQSTDAVRNNIRAQKELILAKAAQKQLQGIAEDMVKAEMELAEATKQHEKNEKALTKATNEAKDAREKYVTGMMSKTEYDRLIANEEEAQKNYDKTAKTIKNLQGDLKNLDKEYTDMESFAQAKLNSAEIEESLKNLVAEAEAAGVEVPKSVSNGISKGKYAIPQSVEEMKALIKYDELAAKAKESGIKIPKSISDGIKSGELQPSQAIAQMDSYITFNDLLNKSSAAGTKVPQNVSNAVITGAMTPQQAVQYMQDLVSFNSLVQKANKAGVDVPSSIKKGVESGKLQPSEAVAQVNKLMVNEANKPKGQMRSAGSSNSSNFSSGISSGKSGVRTAASSVASEGLKGAKSQNSGFYSAGGDMARGIERGTRSRDGSIFGTLRSLASNMLSTFKKAIKSNSPSKLFIEAAEAIPQGIAGGIEKDESLAIKAMKSLGGKIAKESESLTANMGLDNIRTSISGSLAGIRTGVSAGAAGIIAGATGTTNITFNQYNSSPKALDSLEVYRNTQRQLRQFKTWQGGN